MNGLFLTYAALTCLLVVVAVWDLLYLRIPHKLNLAIAALFVLHAALANMSASLIIEHILVASVVFLILFVFAMLTRVGTFGGGDLYFITAVTLFIGQPIAVVQWIIISNVVVVLYIVAFLLMRAFGGTAMLFAIMPGSSYRTLPDWIHRILNTSLPFRNAPVAYGPPYALGAILWIWS